MCCLLFYETFPNFGEEAFNFTELYALRLTIQELLQRATRNIYNWSNTDTFDDRI